MSESPNQRKSRLQLLLVAAVFLGPLLIAALLYYRGEPLQPAGRTNHGALLEPIINLREQSPDSRIHEHDDLWLLVHSRAGVCEEACVQALYKQRQSRLMLGKEMDRLGRVFLHAEDLPDTVLVAEEYQGLITIKDSNLVGLLQNKRPADLPAGGYFLIDPLGNLVLYFRPDIDPADMVDDIKHLLRLSRIG